MKPSPGPWRQSGSLILDARGRPIAVMLHFAQPFSGIEHARDVDRDAPPLTEADANGRAIAALPRTIAALHACYSALGAVDDYPTAAHGRSPDVQNRALDRAMQVFIDIGITP